MIRTLLESLLQFLVIIPFMIILLRKHNKQNYFRILIFVVCFFIYQLSVRLPYLVEDIRLIGGNWNWDGKILGALTGILCYFVFRKYVREHDFFSIKQDKQNFKKSLYVAIGVVVVATIMWFLLGDSEFDKETLLFQLTLPGIDEEIIYRGVLLGLLMSGLKDKIGFLRNPGVLVIAILFGLIHALTLNKNNEIHFELFYFLQTGVVGYAWGWVTIKSRSIALAVLSHNFSNFLGTLVTML